MKQKDISSWLILLSLLVLIPIGSWAQSKTNYEMVIQQKGGSEVAIPIKNGYPRIQSYAVRDLSGDEYVKMSVIYEENSYYQLRADQVNSLTSRPVQSLPALTAIGENWEMDYTNKFKENENLFNRVIDNVYISMDSKDDNGYNEAKQGLVFYSTCPEWQLSYILSWTLGDYRLGLNYPGLIIRVAKGKGSIIVDSQTHGDSEIKILNGNDPWGQSSKTYKLNERGTAELSYRVTKPTYFYIYPCTTKSWSEVISHSDYVVIHGLKIDITTADVENINGESDTYDIYTTDGRLVDRSASSLRKLPKGVYVVKQNDSQTYKYISR